MRFSARISRWALFSALMVVFFLTTQALRPYVTQQSAAPTLVAIPAPVLLMLYGGDRYLAASIESARLLTEADLSADPLARRYFTNLHGNIALLNPCHEDNYYVANAILGWGGGEHEAFDILERASDCRYWDEWPPFYYGFNQYFFQRNYLAAADYMNKAATRSADNRLLFKRLGILMRAKTLSGTSAAIRYLEQEQKTAREEKLKISLGKRIDRLKGLAILEDAQARYEQQLGHRLLDPHELLRKGYLAKVPEDPLKLGYLFVDGRFALRTLDPPPN